MTNKMIWETLSTEYIVRHKYFVARQDVCRMQNGKIIEPYFVVELPPTATALALTEEGKVVLVKQYRHPIGEVIYETPGGFIDQGEDAVTGMKRELLEETGYTFSKVEHLGRLAANPALLTNFTDFFLATGGKKTAGQQLDDNEEIDIVLVSMEELQDMLKRQDIKQSLHVNCIFYGLMKLGLFGLSSR